MKRCRYARPASLLLYAALAGCTVTPAAEQRLETPAATAAPAPGRGSQSASLPPKSLPKVDANPDRLKGLNRADLVAILGEPSFQRVDGPASLLRYRDASCMLDLFLYVPPDGGGEAARVSHIEARDVAGAAVTPRECFGALLRARQGAAG